MAEVQWIKIYTNMFDISRKIKSIEQMPQGDTILIVWFKLLMLAGKVNDGGAIYVTPSFPFDLTGLSYELRRPPEIVEKALSIFEEFDMIERDAGFIYISSWEEYQNIEGMEKIREQNRERKRLQRERQKQALLDDVSRDSHVTVTGRHAIEEEEERDKEKEFHSINRSCESAYIEKKLEESELEGADAEVYKKELQEGLKLKYMGGTLGQGIIFMSDEQFSDLCDKLDIDEIERYFGIIVDCERRGKHYKKKSHYQAVIDMAERDRKVNI
jgi:predicted phage replisome organizer